MPYGSTQNMNRRKVMVLLGGAGAASLAGCTGGGGGGGGGDGGSGGGGGASSGLKKEVEKIDFAGNWKQRRMSSLDEWPYEKRKQIPKESNRTSTQAWLNSESVKSAPWTPPKGWKDTVASEVDTIQVLNYGDMQFDPATAAIDAKFEAATGITVDRLQIVVDQAIPKMAATLSSKKKKPHLLQSTTDTSMTTYARNNWLEPVDFLMPNQEMWNPYIKLANNTFNWNNHLWGSPANNEGMPVHVRPDLLKQQGVSQGVIDRIKNGEWTWKELETVMKAFEGTDVFGWGYRGSSLTYTERDWRVHWYQTGGQYVGSDGKVAVNAKGGGLAALKKMVEWKQKKWVPPAVTSYTQGDLADGFLSGKFAMVPVATDLFVDAASKYTLGEQYVLAPPAKGTQGPNPMRATWGGGPVLATNKFAPTAEKVAGALLQDLRYSLEAGWWEYVVESNMAYPSAAFDQASQTDAVPYSNVRKQTMQVAKNEVFPQQRAIMQKVSEELQLAIAGDKEPKKALQAAQEFINTVVGQG